MRTKEKSGQRGFTNLLKGLFGTFRNPTAHARRIKWNMSEVTFFHGYLNTQSELYSN
jgi:nitrogenase molybdenum-iron protein alpha/beta subunit